MALSTHEDVECDVGYHSLEDATERAEIFLLEASFENAFLTAERTLFLLKMWSERVDRVSERTCTSLPKAGFVQKASGPSPVEVSISLGKDIFVPINLESGSKVNGGMSLHEALCCRLSSVASQSMFELGASVDDQNQFLRKTILQTFISLNGTVPCEFVILWVQLCLHNFVEEDLNCVASACLNLLLHFITFDSLSCTASPVLKEMIFVALTKILPRINSKEVLEYFDSMKITGDGIMTTYSVRKVLFKVDNSIVPDSISIIIQFLQNEDASKFICDHIKKYCLKTLHLLYHEHDEQLSSSSNQTLNMVSSRERYSSKSVRNTRNIEDSSANSNDVGEGETSSKRFKYGWEFMFLLVLAIGFYRRKK